MQKHEKPAHGPSYSHVEDRNQMGDWWNRWLGHLVNRWKERTRSTWGKKQQEWGRRRNRREEADERIVMPGLKEERQRHHGREKPGVWKVLEKTLQQRNCSSEGFW
jgi:hypothetical protein